MLRPHFEPLSESFDAPFFQKTRQRCARFSRMAVFGWKSLGKQAKNVPKLENSKYSNFQRRKPAKNPQKLIRCTIFPKTRPRRASLHENVIFDRKSLRKTQQNASGVKLWKNSRISNKNVSKTVKNWAHASLSQKTRHRCARQHESAIFYWNSLVKTYENASRFKFCKKSNFLNKKPVKIRIKTDRVHHFSKNASKVLQPH